MRIGIVGGTGAAGKALSKRLAGMGHEVLLGSRSLDKATAISESLNSTSTFAGSLAGAKNTTVSTADLVVFATPWDSTLETAASLRSELAGKIVVTMVNALIKIGDELQPIFLARGSVAQSLASVIPQSRVVSALHHVPAKALGDFEHAVEADVLVCSDDQDAKESVMNLLSTIPGVTALDAGSLSSSGAIEAMTAVLINLNIRYRARTVLRIHGLDER